MALGADLVFGQNYPNKSIRIATSDAGGSNDFIARIIAPEISRSLGQPVVIDNREQLIAIEIVMRAPPDGYTLLLGSGNFNIGPLLRKAPYDPARDFSPIALLTTQPSILVVPAALPANSVKELIALAKAKPGELNYASTGIGSLNQLAGELFKSMANVNIVHVPFKTAALALTTLISGEVQLMFAPPGGAAPHLKSGRLRALAVGGAQRSALYPSLPTVAESGLPGYEIAVMAGMFVPAKTPATLINRLNEEIVRVLKRSDVKERLLSIGLDAAPSSPEQLAITLASERSRMGKVIKDAGIRVD
jgi:tripartite-type tricarboxylate transporter receptor subunit TctC